MIPEERDTAAFLLASDLKGAQANDEPLSTEPVSVTEKTASHSLALQQPWGLL